jgi:hypothetical protein
MQHLVSALSVPIVKRDLSLTGSARTGVGQCRMFVLTFVGRSWLQSGVLDSV